MVHEARAAELKPFIPIAAVLVRIVTADLIEAAQLLFRGCVQYWFG